MRILLSVCLLVALSQSVMAQRISQPFRAAERRTIQDVAITSLRQEPRAGMPRWVKWGLVGAVAGAITFPILSGLSAPDDQAKGGVVGDVAAGAAVGFVIVGGSILAWDAVCGGEKRSRRPVLCGR